MKSKGSYACKKSSASKNNAHKQEAVVRVRVRPIMPKSYNASERARLRHYEKQFLVEGNSLRTSTGE